MLNHHLQRSLHRVTSNKHSIARWTIDVDWENVRNDIFIELSIFSFLPKNQLFADHRHPNWKTTKNSKHRQTENQRLTTNIPKETIRDNDDENDELQCLSSTKAKK